MGENLKTYNQQKIPKLATTGEGLAIKKDLVRLKVGGRRKQLEIQSELL